ncbi:MAG: prepilin-type N-terminal cleavage/methylation domain-containing protein [Trueperaceae bacterium]|nr:prepilin-type N-terminal cleavage/methylation domain-containing protein [Trueperaceae bacterium]
MKNAIRHARQNSGFTIIEVLVAIVILGVITAAVLTLLPTVVEINQDSASDVDVTIEARSYLETVRATLPVVAAENTANEETAFARIANSATGNYQDLYTTVDWETSVAPWNNTAPPPVLADANELPAPDRYTCTTTFQDPDAGAYPEVVRLRFQLTCTSDSDASDVYEYVVDVGRPQ